MTSKVHGIERGYDHIEIGGRIVTPDRKVRLLFQNVLPELDTSLLPAV